MIAKALFDKQKVLYLSVRWCQTFASVDSYQCVFLYRDVELNKAWLLHVELRAPENPWWDALARPLPNIHLSRVDGVVFLMDRAAPSCETEHTSPP